MILDIMKYLTTQLKNFNPRVFNQNATQNAIFPYVVFNLTSSSVTEKDREDVILEIDIWDYMKDGYDALVNVEQLTDSIDKFFRFNRYDNENQVLIFQKMSRLSIPDTDENIRRRQLRFVVKCYDKNQYN